MIIDVGSGEGVEKNMPVITPAGVVGSLATSILIRRGYSS